MRCKEVNKLLSAYQDGRLTQKEREEVRGHLQTCASCQKEERLLLNIWDMMNLLDPVEPSTDFKARFWQRVRKSGHRRPSARGAHAQFGRGHVRDFRQRRKPIW